MLKLFLLAALTACAPLDTAEAYVSDHGTVYVCDGTELCWDGSTLELERLTGSSCHPIAVEERAWPALVGCAYCCGAGCPTGCNAHGGCFCPPDGAS